MIIIEARRLEPREKRHQLFHEVHTNFSEGTTLKSDSLFYEGDSEKNDFYRNFHLKFLEVLVLW